MFLEHAKKVALEDMQACDGLHEVAERGPRDIARMIGLGYAVAKGWAAYSGNGIFEITIDGKAALAELLNPELY